jgi:SAM-dependent methyltransferase
LPQPGEAELNEFYRAFHLSNNDGGKYDDMESRMQSDFPAKARLARSLASHAGARLLDVGCGKGYFLKEAQSRGFEGIGIDLSTTGIDFAKTQLGVKAIPGRIEFDAPPEWRNAFDIATFWATIEHIPDPVATIRAIGQCLKPGGRLLIDTGLADSLWERFLCGHSQWYDAPQHLWVFGANGLRTAIEQSGLSVERMDRNYDRSPFRRVIRRVRHAAICVGSFLSCRLPLGGRGFQMAKQSTKWPIGRLVSVIARKPVQ